MTLTIFCEFRGYYWVAKCDGKETKSHQHGGPRQAVHEMCRMLLKPGDVWRLKRTFPKSYELTIQEPTSPEGVKAEGCEHNIPLNVPCPQCRAFQLQTIQSV